MNPVARAVLKAGLISPELQAQFKQWGCPIDADGPDLKIDSPEQLTEILELALQNEGMVLMRTTDLDIIKQYYSTQKPGALHLTIDGISQSFLVSFGISVSKEIIIPWRAETIEEVMTDSMSWLESDSDDRQTTTRMYFSDVREVFFGDVKAFMVCTVGGVAKSGGPSGVDLK